MTRGSIRIPNIRFWNIDGECQTQMIIVPRGTFLLDLMTRCIIMIPPKQRGRTMKLLLTSILLISTNVHAFNWNALAYAINKTYQPQQRVQQYQRSYDSGIRAVRDGNTVRYYSNNGGHLVGWATYSNGIVYKYNAIGVLISTTRIE